jgi:hypothetical protein
LWILFNKSFRVKPKGEDIHNISTRCEGIPKISLALGYVEDAPHTWAFFPIKHKVNLIISP